MGKLSSAFRELYITSKSDTNMDGKKGKASFIALSPVPDFPTLSQRVLFKI